MKEKEKRRFTNFKMEEISPWDMKGLRNTKEYQEKREKFIEENRRKCKVCPSIERLTISHPQQYLKIIYSKEKGKFYSIYSKLKYKEVCPKCYFDKAYKEVVHYKSEWSNYKKRRTMVKFKHRCPNCQKRYKYPKKIKIDRLRVITELTNYQIPNTINYMAICSKIQEKMNQQQWEKYISFKDAELVCRDCHYLDHFVSLIILNETTHQNEENISKISSRDLREGN